MAGMPENPAISVVIPTYNAAKFLREALDSLVAQTFADWEAVCVNDGSTDNSLEILQEYAARDARFRILDGPNGGYGKAMNRGMDAARGTYMAILEPDDILPVRAYEVLWRNAQEYGLDVSRGAASHFYTAENGECVHEYWVDAVEPDRVFCPADSLAFMDSVPSTWSALYRLDFLRDSGIRHHETPGASYQDAGFFFLTAAYAARCMVSHEVVYLYRTDNAASSVRKRIRDLETVSREYFYVQSRLGAAQLQRECVRLALHRRFVEGNLWLYGILADDQREEFLRCLGRDLPVFAGESVHLFPEGLRQRAEAIQQGPAAFMALLHAEQERAQAEQRREFAGKQGMFFKSGPGWRECRVLGVPVFRVEMSAAVTRRLLFGIPLFVRRRVDVLQEVAPGQRVPVGRRDVYRLAGIPVAEKVRGTKPGT